MPSFSFSGLGPSVLRFPVVSLVLVDRSWFVLGVPDRVVDLLGVRCSRCGWFFFEVALDDLLFAELLHLEDMLFHSSAVPLSPVPGEDWFPPAATATVLSPNVYRCYCASFSVKMTGFNFNSHSSLREQVPKAIRLITCEQIDPCSGLALDTYIVLLAMYCSMVNPSGKRAQRAPSLLHISGGLEPCRSAKCTCYYVHACKHDSRLHPFRIK